MDKLDKIKQDLEAKQKIADKHKEERDKLKKAFKNCFDTIDGVKVMAYLREVSTIDSITNDINPNMLIYNRGKIDMYLIINNMLKGE